MQVKEITDYKGRFCAHLADGRYMLSDGTMEMILCEKVPEGMKVIESGIIGGTMMRTREEFKWCVEHWEPKS